MIYIYGLKCPDSGEIRYIGKSDNPKKRLLAHINAARAYAYDHHTARWLRKLDCKQKRPMLVILQEVLNDQDWRQIEREWIAKAKVEGWPITNTTAGGEGLDYIDPEAEAAYVANHAAAMAKWSKTISGKNAVQKMLQASQTPEAKAKRRQSQRLTWQDPDRKAKLTLAITKAQNKPETKKKRSDSSRAAWARDPAGMKNKIWTAETREAHKAAIKLSNTDPEKRRNRNDARWTSESRDKQRAELESRRDKMGSSPEGRERQKQAMRDIWAKRKAEGKRNLHD